MTQFFGPQIIDFVPCGLFIPHAFYVSTGIKQFLLLLCLYIYNISLVLQYIALS